jgi:hypothetical protein
MLEKLVDDGQKKRCKEILLCRVSSCLLGLRPDQEGSSEVVSGVAYVELTRRRETTGCSGLLYGGIV